VCRSAGDERAVAVAAALAPYAWRELTDRMLARLVVGAIDRHSLVHFLTTVPGADVGGLPPAEPAEAADDRVDVLVQALDGQLWRDRSLARLCADLLRLLDAWRADRESLESDLRRLLEGH
jgi:hypothetical protein